jgi:hypothetical protein
MVDEAGASTSAWRVDYARTRRAIRSPSANCVQYVESFRLFGRQAHSGGSSGPRCRPAANVPCAADRHPYLSAAVGAARALFLGSNRKQYIRRKRSNWRFRRIENAELTDSRILSRVRIPPAQPTGMPVRPCGLAKLRARELTVRTFVRTFLGSHAKRRMASPVHHSCFQGLPFSCSHSFALRFGC